jgi:hypothetical protein
MFAPRATLVACCSLWPALAQAGDPVDPMTQFPVIDPAATRTLGGHHFLPSLIVGDPFVDTYFESVFAVGTVTGTGPGFTLVQDASGHYSAKQMGTFDVSLAALEQHFAGQMGLTPWWSIRIQGGGSFLAATNGTTGLSVGVLIAYSATIGTTLSVPIGSSTRIGATFDVDVNHSFSLDLLGTIVRSVQAGMLDTSQMISETNTMTVRPGLAAAFGIHKGVGLVLAAQYLHSSIDTQRLIQPGNEGTIEPGAVLSFDLNALASIPIGIGLSYSPSIPLNGGSVWHGFDGGLYYNGNRDLALGIEIGIKNVDFNPGVSIVYKNLNVVIRYTWW